MLYKRRRERNRKKIHRNYIKKNIGTKLITNTKNQKLNIQSIVWNFKNTTFKKKDEKEREKKKTNKQSRKNYKENIGTKLTTNTKKQKLNIQSRVWNFKNTVLKKRRRKRKGKKKPK